MVLCLDVCAIVEDRVDEAERAKSDRPLEGVPAMLRVGEEKAREGGSRDNWGGDGG
jgi:hypothetical protein